MSQDKQQPPRTAPPAEDTADQTLTTAQSTAAADQHNTPSRKAVEAEPTTKQLPNTSICIPAGTRAEIGGKVALPNEGLARREGCRDVRSSDAILTGQLE